MNHGATRVIAVDAGRRLIAVKAAQSATMMLTKTMRLSEDDLKILKLVRCPYLRHFYKTIPTMSLMARSRSNRVLLS